MAARIRAYLRRQHLALVAVFMAATGTAVALPGANTVDSGDIKPNAVKSADIAAGAVTGSDLKEGSLDFNIVQRRVTGACGAGEAANSVGVDGSLGCVGLPAPDGGDDVVVNQVFNGDLDGPDQEFGLFIGTSYTDLLSMPLKLSEKSTVFAEGTTAFQPNAPGAVYDCIVKLDGAAIPFAGDVHYPAANEDHVYRPSGAKADVAAGDHLLTLSCRYSAGSATALTNAAALYAHAIPQS